MERVNFHENRSSLPEELTRNPGHGRPVQEGVREEPAGAGVGQGQAGSDGLKEWQLKAAFAVYISLYNTIMTKVTLIP